MKTPNGWTVALVIYILTLLLTLIPVLTALAKKSDTEVHSIYNKVDHLSDLYKGRLQNNLVLLYPMIAKWVKLERVYGRFQIYALFWTILASVLVPILAQAIDATPQAKWFLTLVSVHASVLLALNKGMSVDDKLKLYSDARSDLNDLDRNLHAYPKALGSTPEEVIDGYIRELNSIVDTVRVGEGKPVVLPEPGNSHVKPGTSV